jgi:predicted N-acetyltransferase YhbS
VTVEIRPARQVDDALVAAFARLIPQLSSSSPPPDAAALTAIVDNPHSVLFLAEEDGEIVGSLTLAFYRIPTCVKAWIEDVVVDDAVRGKGVGEALNRAAIAEAAHRGAKHVSLTSRPSASSGTRPTSTATRSDTHRTIRTN